MPLSGFDARHHRFGERVALDDTAAGQLFELRLCRGHQRRGPGERRTNGTEVDRLAPDLRVVEERDEERGHRAEERGFHGLNRFEQVVDVARVRDERHRRAADDRMTLHADARVHVEQGQRDQRDVVRRVFRRMQPQVQLHARRHETTMQADNGLGRPRRAPAHQHDGRIVWFRGATEVAHYRSGTGVPTCGLVRGRCVRLQTVLKPCVAGLEVDSMAVLLFLEQREERAKERR